MMAVVNSSSITDVTEVDSQKDSSEKEHSISNKDSNISEEPLFGNSVDCNDEKMHVKASNLPDNSCVEDNIDDDEHREDKLKANEACISEDIDNNINDEKLSRRFLDLVDSDSEEEINHSETVDDESIAISTKQLSKPKHLQNAKYKKVSLNEKKKNSRRIESDSEDDLPSSSVDDFSETIKKTVNAKVNRTKIRYMFEYIIHMKL